MHVGLRCLCVRVFHQQGERFRVGRRIAPAQRGREPLAVPAVRRRYRRAGLKCGRSPTSPHRPASPNVPSRWRHHSPRRVNRNSRPPCCAAPVRIARPSSLCTREPCSKSGLRRRLTRAGRRPAPRRGRRDGRTRPVYRRPSGIQSGNGSYLDRRALLKPDADHLISARRTTIPRTMHRHERIASILRGN